MANDSVVNHGSNSPWNFPLSRFPVVVLSGAMWIGLCQSLTMAQVITNITPDGSLGTKVPAECTVCDITGGTRPGNGQNLFHSFADFDVGQSGVANFVNDSGLPTTNILSRVTGGNPSNIYGTIQTQNFQNANLYLMNPAGIVFGQGASLNVGGATHFTTADYLQLSDGVQFTALPSAQDALLSVAPVAAFGFLASNPADILVGNSTLAVGDGQTLSFVGGDLEISGGSLQSPDGRVNLVSLNAPGTVDVNAGGELQVQAAQLGQIGLSNNASVNVDGVLGGEVIIRGGRLIMDNAVISSNTSGSPDAQIAAAGLEPGIDIRVTGDVHLDNLAKIETNVFGGSNPGGDITLYLGGNLEIRGGNFDENDPFGSFSGIKTFAFDGSGNAGNIEVNANKIIINGEWLTIQSASFTTGNSGKIRLEANGLEMVGGDPITGDENFITTLALGAGLGGDVDVNIGGGNISLVNSTISSTTTDVGTGGNVTVQANNLQMTDGSTIQTGTFFEGNSGKTSILLSGDLEIRSGSFLGSLVDVFCTEGCGAAGDLAVQANDITIQGFKNAVDPLSSPEFTGMRTRSVAEVGGHVEISGNNLTMSDNGVIRSASIGAETAGNITVNLRGNLELTNKGQFLATTSGSGNAGDTTVLAKNITISGNSSVKAESTSKSVDAGDAGNIQLTATDTILLDGGTITTEAAKASGGNIELEAEELIRLNNSTIASSVEGDETTKGGNINLDPEFIILQNSRILAKAGKGKGGDIFLTANVVLVDPLSEVNASATEGISGSVNIQAPIQNLSGTIAPLPDGTAPVTALYGTRCVAGAGGHFSTFVDSKVDSLTPRPGTFLASPFLPQVTSPPAGVLGHAVMPAGVSDRGQIPSIQLAAYSPPVLFQHGVGMYSACP